MALIQAPEPKIKAETKPETKKDQSGIALFMVIAAISVLSILVTEFTYIAQVNQKMAFDGLDQLKAHYLAKTGLKISLLRLKAFQNVKTLAAGMLKGADPKAADQFKPLIDKIWSFPFYYPFPTNIPGMTPGDKEQIKKFEKASGLEGKFAAFIESESSRYNLNSIVEGFSAPAPIPSAGPSTTPSTTPSAAPSFNPDSARQSLHDYLEQILAPKLIDDPAFADAYRDPHLLDDLMDNIWAWTDHKHERRSQSGDMPMKGGPFYSVSELHMIPGMDDDLYNLFAPNLTVTRTAGINVNTMKDVTVKAFFPLVTKEELEDFFKNRDSEDIDGTFKSEDEFYKYVKAHFQAYERGDTLDKIKEDLGKKNIHFVIEDTEYKITVQSTVNQSTRLIEAWVTLTAPKDAKNPNPGPSGTPPAQPPVNNSTGSSTTNGGNAPPPDPGLKIHFMRVL